MTFFCFVPLEMKGLRTQQISLIRRRVLRATSPEQYPPGLGMESIDLLFPGLEIREACADRMPADMSAVDGSSTATAGLLLSILSGTAAEKEGLTRQRHDKMKKTMTNVAGNTKHVQVWDLFDDYIGAPEGDE